MRVCLIWLLCVCVHIHNLYSDIQHHHHHQRHHRKQMVGPMRPQLICTHSACLLVCCWIDWDCAVTSNELVIGRLQRHHSLAIIMCQAINSNISGPVSNSITLDMNCKFHSHTHTHTKQPTTNGQHSKQTQTFVENLYNFVVVFRCGKVSQSSSGGV